MDMHAMKDEEKTKTQLIYELTGLRQRNVELEETFRQFRKTAEDLEKELENISMELAISLSEVFEALKKIASGDPEVRISEESEFEIISKLKYMVNLTAKDIGEMVDQSHEFAMGLAEHFDVLHKVSKGDLNARVSGKSEVELLESLKNVMNETIESIDREISDRKLAEVKLSKSEKNLRDITSHLGEGIYVLDRHGQITFMNPEAERLLGWTMNDLNEKGAHNLVHYQKADGTPLPFEECNMQNVMKTGKHFISTDEVFVRKDGTIIPIFVISSPIIEDGKIIASVTAFRDITERKRIEKERENLIDELQKALATIKTLHGILPICSYCKKIRDDKGSWNQLEAYISEHTDAKFSHGLCSECAKKMYPEYYKE